MIYRFGRFELDDQRFELRCGGQLVPLPARPFDLLRTLVRKRDSLVTKDEIMAEVWRGVLVTKDSLPQTMMVVRRALEDDSENPQFIVTVRGRGYRFVAEVTEVDGATTPSSARTPHAAEREKASTLIGRGDALAALREAATQAENGRGRVVFLTGEAGLGKTRLISELCSATEVLSFVVSCRAPEGAPDPWPFVQLLREAERHGAELDEELMLLATRGLAAKADGSKSAQFRLLDRIAASLESFADGRTLIVVLDDLHLASASTVTLLDLFARRVHKGSILLIGAYRPGVAIEPSFESTAFTLAREPFASVVRLLPFTREETAVYIERAVGRTPPRSLLDRLFEKTKGNPSFLAELVHILRTEEDLRGEVGTSALVGGDGMREAIASLLGSLPDSVRRVLTMAAVFGGTFPLTPLAVALETKNAVVLEALDAAVAVRIVERVEAGTYRFTYPLVRDVLHKRLTESERARLHAVAAAVLIRHGGNVDTHEQAGEIAAHLVESAAAGEVDGALDWSLRAARLAHDAGAKAAAKTYAERGLRALRFASKPDIAREEGLRAFVHVRPT